MVDVETIVARGQSHLAASRWTNAIEDFTSAIAACGEEDNERKALAYWGRSCAYHTGAGFIDGPDDGVTTADEHLAVKHMDLSRRDEQEAARLFWTAHGSTHAHDEHEFEVPGEIVRTRDLLHEFLATSDWGEWSDDRSQKNTNNHRYFRRGNFIFGSPARMGRWAYDDGISRYKYWSVDPRAARDTYKPATLQVTLRSEPNGTRVQMKYGDIIPEPSFPWWMAAFVVPLAEVSETIMGALKRRYLKRESYLRLKELERLHHLGEALGCEEYLRQILAKAIST